MIHHDTFKFGISSFFKPCLGSHLFLNQLELNTHNVLSPYRQSYIGLVFGSHHTALGSRLFFDPVANKYQCILLLPIPVVAKAQETLFFPIPTSKSMDP
jgi:hypothetical protein